MTRVREIYVICDITALERAGVDALAFSDACIMQGPWALQLRAKHASREERETLARALRARTRAAGVRFVVNDDADLAARVEADMVHVGQGDERVALVRARHPRLGVGVSTHVLAELEQAILEQPSYVAFGPVYATASKDAHEPVVGPELLARAATRARQAGVSLVAIGGLDATRVRTLYASAACAPHAVAMIGVLVNAMRDGGEAGVRAAFAELTS